MPGREAGTISLAARGNRSGSQHVVLSEDDWRGTLSDTSKLIVAFFLGLAVALGSIALYMRQQQPAPAMAVSAPAPQSAPLPAAPVVPPVAAPINPEPLAAPEPVRKAAAAPVRKAKPRVEEQEKASNLQSSTAPTPAASPFAPPPPPAFTPSPAPPAAAAQPHTISLALGTVLNVRLNQNLTSEKNASGDTFLATLAAPIIVDGFVIADHGSKVQGQVVEADRSGRVKFFFLI